MDGSQTLSRDSLSRSKVKGFCTMRQRIIRCLAAVALCPVAAQADYETGQAAWDAGRHTEAVIAWEGAARANDTRAMLALGRAFVRGVGVPQDFVEAHKWLNLAAGLGDADAAAERDALGAEMTVEERAEARRLARAWRIAGESALTDTSPPDMPEAMVAPPSPAAPPERALREAQDLLATLGYAPGPADGKWGQRSIEAYRSFLGDAGMELSDVLTPEALRAMRELARAAVSATAAPALSPDVVHEAVQAGNLDALAAALAAGGNVDQRDGRGWTPLMHAANLGYVLMVSPLLEAGANVNLRAADGATALFMATAHGHSDIIEQLMAAGADTVIPGPDGQTAIDVARLRYGDPETAPTGQLNQAVLALIRGMTGVEAREMAQMTAGSAFRDCDECPEMVVVPAGSFMMGSPASEEGRYDNEGPVHRVTLPVPFAVGKYEVTFAEWDACEAAGGCDEFTYDRGWGRGRRPVINVTWEDAQAYVRWLSRQTGERYRLLSESEWEYVARAGSATRYAWGDEIGRNRANCDGCGSQWDDESTAPMGSFAANAFGLHDMHGNVWEWVEDCWNETYVGAPADGTARQNGDCTRHAARGGSWFFLPRNLRSASRARVFHLQDDKDLGFRVAKTLAP